MKAAIHKKEATNDDIVGICNDLNRNMVIGFGEVSQRFDKVSQRFDELDHKIDYNAYVSSAIANHLGLKLVSFEEFQASKKRQ